MNGAQPAEAWIFRDDIGAPHGIKGYEEQVNSVGMHHGHNHFPADITWNTFNSATYETYSNIYLAAITLFYFLLSIVSEEVSRFSPELARVATVLCIRSTICSLTRVSPRESL